ncbi:hypothetical protein D3C86_2180950 [compost metagenome]
MPSSSTAGALMTSRSRDSSGRSESLAASQRYSKRWASSPLASNSFARWMNTSAMSCAMVASLLLPVVL